MPHYFYEALESREFQRLIAAIINELAGGHSTNYPLDQPDGGRDITTASHTYQVKFVSEPKNHSGLLRWVDRVFDEELPKIARLVERGYTSYTLITNLQASSALDRGTMDIAANRAARRAEQLGLESLTIWWRADLDARMAAASDAIKRSFIRAIPMDEALRLVSLDQTDISMTLKRALTSYMAAEFKRESKLRFEQADLNVPSLEKLYVDVHARKQNSTVRGDTRGAAATLLDPTWQSDAVIIGGPGQGKTTVLQYVAQVTRAAFLGKLEEIRVDDGFPTDHIVPRIPIKINLQDFVEWASKESKFSSGQIPSLEEYLCFHIRRGSGGIEFRVEDLHSIISLRPVLLIFDGLDEVADISIRLKTAEQIALTTQRLHAITSAAVILVATRPGLQSGVAELGRGFSELSLQQLTPRLQIEFLEKWSALAELGRDEKLRLGETFQECIQLSHIQELASTPMQLAILLHLIQRRGVLPEQRTELYRDYVQVFLDRESGKEMLVREHRALIEDAHAAIAWRIHAYAESNSEGSRLGLTELSDLLENFVHSHGYPGELVQRLFISITSRVICLVQRVPGTVEFEVQPLREYFAARFLHDTAPLLDGSGTKDERLAALVVRPYWLNVLRFFCGMLSRGEVRGLVPLLRQLAADGIAAVLPNFRSILLLLLSDQIFLRLGSAQAREVIDYALADDGIVLLEAGLYDAAPGGRMAGGGDAYVAEHIFGRLRQAQVQGLQEALVSALSRVIHGEEHLWDRAANLPPHALFRLVARCNLYSDLTGAQKQQFYDRLLELPTSSLFNLIISEKMAAKDPQMLHLMARGFSAGSDHIDSSNYGRLPSEVVEYWMHPARFYEHRLRVITHSQQNGLGAEQFMGPTAGIARMHSSTRVWDKVENWRDGLSAVYELVGDCWLLREALFSIPEEIFEEGDSWQPSLLAAPWSGELRYALQLRFEALQHKRDPKWWLQQRPSESSSLDCCTWLLALLVYGGSDSLEACLASADTYLVSLDTCLIRGLVTSTLRIGRLGEVGRRSLRVPWTTTRLSPLLASLILSVATKESSRSLIAIASKDLATLYAAAGRHLIRLLLKRRQELGLKPLDGLAFLDTRGFEEGNEEYSTLSIDLPSLSATAARRVLLEAHRWPKDIIVRAAEVLQVAAGTSKPLLMLASEQRWFEQ